MHMTTALEKRQLWALPSDTPTPGSPHRCAPYTLAANGVLSLGQDNLITLSETAVFTPLCTDAAGTNVTRPAYAPFYASSTPQVFVVAAAMVLAWVLVIMLIISPRTYHHGSGIVTFATRRGIIAGAHGGSTSSMGIGSRPWLQKAAALTVAISLTIAVADTFIVSQKHYPAGIDGNALRALVENSLEIRISRVISDVFVLLAQVQTLIRVFPRHKEKVLIKWIGFALITLDITFTSLNSFLPEIDYRRPRDFVDAIPALSYLFELALSLLYSAWIIYYAFTKRQYAFYHSKMKTITFIAFLALVAIMTPTVFFVTDITLPNIAGWGDYFRWVGAAASSVVVWEWVERIEILERDEKKDGILGREVFEGDEMLDFSSNEEMTYHGRRNDNYFPRGKGSGGDTTITSLGTRPHGFSRHLLGVFRRKQNRPAQTSDADGTHSRSTSSSDEHKDSEDLNGVGPLPRRVEAIRRDAGPTLPAPALSPPPRTDTVSAASTVYVVRQDGATAVEPVRRRIVTPDAYRPVSIAQQVTSHERPGQGLTTGLAPLMPAWHVVTNPFKRKRTTPPAEVRAVMTTNDEGATDGVSGERRLNLNMKSSWDVRGRLDGLKSRAQLEPKAHAASKRNIEDMAWTIIPAQPRGQAWMPSPPPLERSVHDNSTSPAPPPEPTSPLGANFGPASPQGPQAEPAPLEDTSTAHTEDSPAQGRV